MVLDSTLCRRVDPHAYVVSGSGVGLANTMFYMNPNNARWLTPSDAAKVEVSDTMFYMF